MFSIHGDDHMWVSEKKKRDANGSRVGIGSGLVGGGGVAHNAGRAGSAHVAAFQKDVLDVARN